MTDFRDRRRGEDRRHAEKLRAAEITNLKQALESRHLIGMAQGMVMLRCGVSEQHAFEYLSRRSQDSNIKLRDLVVTVIQELLEERERPAHPAGGTPKRPTS